MLEIAGCIVTSDAMGCQTESAQAIVDLDADYVLVVKENPSHRYQDITELFDAAQKVNFKDVSHDYIAFLAHLARLQGCDGPPAGVLRA